MFLWVKWHVQRPLNLINEIQPIRLWWDYGWHLPIILLLIKLLGVERHDIYSHKNNSDTFLTMWCVGNSMVLHLVSLYWYSTVMIPIPPCMHPNWGVMMDLGKTLEGSVEGIFYSCPYSKETLLVPIWRKYKRNTLFLSLFREVFLAIILTPI